MNKSYGLALLSVLVLAGFAMGSVIGSAKAQSQISNIPQFLPASGWTVQQSEFAEVRGLQGVNLPCMMATSYDNGYSLRFSGASQKILAMAIDFRQDVFVQGRKYPTTLNVDGSGSRDLSGTAFSQSVLIFNLREMSDFYNTISGATKMTLNVDGNPMVFALGSIGNALSELEGCSGGGVNKAVIQQASLPLGGVAKTLNEPVNDSPKWGQDVPAAPARVSKKSKIETTPIWEARAGDDMKSTLERWAFRSGVQLDWQAAQGGTVSDNIKVQGSFEEAVQALMARNAAALGLDANMKSAAGVTRSGVSRVSHAPQQLIPGRVTRARDSATGGTAKWSAPVGASLQHVLQAWSKRAGVELVWESNRGFAVRLPINTNGSYEDALQSLLNQYGDEKTRPNAQLNNDPVTGRRTLFIQSSRVL